MEYGDVKRCLRECAELKGLEEAAAAELFWRAEEQTLYYGEVVYSQGSPLDDTFGLLLSGDLIVESDGAFIKGISEQKIFGEMAYFTNHRARTAMVRVASAEAVILRFRVTPAELAGTRFGGLRRCLAVQTWSKFVSTYAAGRELAMER